MKQSRQMRIEINRVRGGEAQLSSVDIQFNDHIYPSTAKFCQFPESGRTIRALGSPPAERGIRGPDGCQKRRKKRTDLFQGLGRQS